MQKDQAENLMLVTAAVAKEHQLVESVVVARNLAKLQRLAVSLGKRYVAKNYTNDTNEKEKSRTLELETHAIELAAALSVKIFFQRASGYSPIGLSLREGEQFLF